jgi:hypothetical protein
LYLAAPSVREADFVAARIKNRPYQIQYRHLHHALVEVCCTILDDFDGNDLLGLQVLALDNLAEGTLAENVENEVSVPKERHC